MKISQQPTNHILVKAYCQSEWDNCDFAIIACYGGWKERMQKRIDVARLFDNDDDLFSFRYSDYNAGFYVSKDGQPEDLLSEIENGAGWVFVELEQGEEDEFQTPESRLDCHMLNLYIDGTGAYTAYGKHTGEEYYTESLPFAEIINQMN